MTAPRGLHALARLHGVQTAYYDHAGRRVGASPEGLMAALRALGVPVHGGGDIPAALARRRRALWERVVEPVVTAWLPDPDPFALRVPARLSDAVIRVTANLEDGGERTRDVAARSLAVTDRTELTGRSFVELEVPLPSVPTGYHDLRVEVGGARFGALLVAAPRRCAGWEVLPGSPAWGVFAPLFALWSEEAPDRVPWFGLLDRLAGRVAELGGSVLGTLPLLASFLDRPYEPSPYAPVSKLFWNELYVADRQGGTGGDGGGGVAPGSTLDHGAAMAARRGRLAASARAFFRAHDHASETGEGAGRTDPRRGLEVPPEMAAFVARNPRAPDYARFRALTEARGPWPGWADRLRARDVRGADYDPELARYHLYAQWQAERQLAEAEERAASRGVALYLDLPVGVHPAGYDTWRDRDQFALDATVGAPPDPLAPDGQDWGCHPPHPETTRLDGHRYFIAAIRKHLRFARVLRIDHVMQLHRLFWVPQGIAADGVYVGYPHEELYAILSLESHRAGSVIVGEDLGTVPRTVRRAMRRRGVGGTYVVQFSLREATDSAGAVDSAGPTDSTGSADPPETAEALVPGRVSRGALAAIGTHDTPMFAAWWTGRDAETRADRGLMTPEEAEAQVRGRVELRDKLARGLGVRGGVEGGVGSVADPGLAGGSDASESRDSGLMGLDRSVVEEGLRVQEALYRFLGRSKAGLVLATLEDLWMETEPQNVPGTSGAENWGRRARRPLEALSEGAPARLLTALNVAREGTE